MKTEKRRKAQMCHIAVISWLMLSMVTATIKAEPVDVEKARAVALTQLQKVTGAVGLRLAASLELAYEPKNETNQPYFYVFNGNNGFVIVSGDDRVAPVLGYSDEGSFDPNNIPPNMAEFLKCYEQEIDSVVKNNIQAEDDNLKTEWLNLRNGNITVQKKLLKEEKLYSANSVSQRSYEVGDYLIKTKWGQGSNVEPYYNALCPYDSSVNKRTLVGCVATAMAQIIRYWGTDRGMAPTHGYGVVGPVNFETSYYDYDNMPVAINGVSSAAQKNAVALLSYHCGVASSMNYGVGSSFVSTLNAVSAFRDHFGYSNVAYNGDRSVIRFTLSELINVFMSNISAGLPVLYAVRDHAFVCDGYNVDGKFHMNWGWDGKDDGWYSLTALCPTDVGGDYSYVSDKFSVLYGIYPVRDVCDPDVVKRGQLENISWRISDSILTISGVGDMPSLQGTQWPWASYRYEIKKVDIKDGITNIGYEAIAYCPNLIAVKIPNSVTRIEFGAFAACYLLSDIEIPNSVVSIGGYAFYSCVNLSDINIPNGVTKIEYSTFSGCRNLTNIEIPSSVKSIERDAFYQCGLTNIEIPSSVISIGREAFNGCSLTRINLPQGITTIGLMAFASNPTSYIKIPSSVTKIDAYAFCSNYATDIYHLSKSNVVEVFWDVPLSIYSTSFYYILRENCNNLSCDTLIVPEGAKALYEAADGWKDFGTIIERPIAESVSIYMTLLVGHSIKLGAAITPSNAAYQNVTWSSSDDAIVMVNTAGKVTAIAPGRVTLTATTVIGGISSSFDIKVEENDAIVTPYSGEIANEWINENPIDVALEKGVLMINSPDKETIRIYSMTGALLFFAEKSEGKQTYSIPNLSKEIYVVTGSSGWSVKVRNN